MSKSSQRHTSYFSAGRAAYHAFRERNVNRSVIFSEAHEMGKRQLRIALKSVPKLHKNYFWRGWLVGKKGSISNTQRKLRQAVKHAR